MPRASEVGHRGFELGDFRTGSNPVRSQDLGDRRDVRLGDRLMPVGQQAVTDRTAPVNRQGVLRARVSGHVPELIPNVRSSSTDSHWPLVSLLKRNPVGTGRPWSSPDDGRHH